MGDPDQKLNVQIELRLDDCEESRTEVYGTLKGSQLSSNWTFFDKDMDDRVTVRKGELIPLDKTSFQAVKNLSLEITAHVSDYRQGTPGKIAEGIAKFTVYEGTFHQKIEGQYGSVTVTITA